MKPSQPMLRHVFAGVAALWMLSHGVAAQAQTVFVETFGSSAARVNNAYVPAGNFAYKASGVVGDGDYTVMPPQNIAGSTGSAYWTDLPSDHTGDPSGALMVLNAGPALNEFYVRDFNVQPGHKYRVSAWRYVVNGDMTTLPAPGGPISWRMEVRDPGTGNALVQSGDLPSTSTGTWLESTYEFTAPQSVGAQARLALVNRSPVTSGNDFYIDDISVVDITPAAVPTLEEWALMLLSVTLVGLAALGLRRSGRPGF